MVVTGGQLCTWKQNGTLSAHCMPHFGGVCYFSTEYSIKFRPHSNGINFLVQKLSLVHTATYANPILWLFLYIFLHQSAFLIPPHSWVALCFSVFYIHTCCISPEQAMDLLIRSAGKANTKSRAFLHVESELNLVKGFSLDFTNRLLQISSRQWTIVCCGRHLIDRSQRP